MLGCLFPKTIKKIAKNKYKKKAIANVGESMENIESLRAATGMHLKIKKVRIEVPCDTTILYLGKCPKDIKISLLPW